MLEQKSHEWASENECEVVASVGVENSDLVAFHTHFTFTFLRVMEKFTAW